MLGFILVVGWSTVDGLRHQRGQIIARRCRWQRNAPQVEVNLRISLRILYRRVRWWQVSKNDTTSKISQLVLRWKRQTV